MSLKFQIFAQNGGQFSNGMHSAIIKYGVKNFSDSIAVEDRYIIAKGNTDGIVVLAKYGSEERAKQVRAEMLDIYDNERGDYILPSE